MYGSSSSETTKRFAVFRGNVLLRGFFSALGDVDCATPREPGKVVCSFASTRARAENRLRVRA